MPTLFLSTRLTTVGLLLFCVTRVACCLQALNARSSSTLYVLSSPERLSPPGILPYSELLFVDPTTGRIRRTIRIGFSADAQLSPDGKRIYVTSSYVSNPDAPDRKCFIETFDMVTGALIAKVLNPDGQQFSLSIHDAKAMIVSPNGRWLYLTKMNVNIRTKSWNLYVAAFDTSKQSFLAASFSLAGCENPTLLPSAKDLELYATCAGSTSVHKISFNQSSALGTLVPLPGGFKKSWLAALVDEVNIGTLTFISGAGDVISMDTLTGQLTGRGRSLRFGRNLGSVRALVSGTRREAYFGSAMKDHNWSERFDEIIGIDANSGAVVRTARVQPFFNMALSRDGRTIFVLRPLQSTITVVDAATMKDSMSIRLVGKTPYYATAR